MAESVALHPPLSVEKYLELERDSLIRHEFVRGQLYAMTGTTKRHNLIVGNIWAALREAARGTPCRVYSENVKVRTPEDTVYYPDVMVACEPDSDDPYVEREPCLIVEVISPTTESADRREKLAAYSKISTLQAYLIVDQNSPKVQLHLMGEDGQWLQADFIGDGVIPVPCPRTELTLATIYEGL
ncbi:MAG: Uma2 family endonuclease [Chloroflexota bacterium]|nr:Uma2 family endonuclease [Chloroflexota bacterium]